MGGFFVTWLPLPDLARCEMASKGVRDALLLSRSWEDVAWETLSGFAFGSQVMACSPSIDTLKLQQRRLEVKLLVSQLQGVEVRGSSLVPVPNIACARQIASAVQRGKNAVSAHVASGDVAARIFVGQVIFPLSSTALQDGSDTVIPSKPIAFSFAGEAGGKAADEMFRLKFAWSNDALFLRILGPDARNEERGGLDESLANAHENIMADDEETDDESDYDSDDEDNSDSSSKLRRRNLEVDVCVAGPAPLVRTRGTVLQIGGGWRKAQGVVSACMAPAAFAALLSEGLTFVVSVRDSRSAVGASPFYIHALNIEPTRQ